MGTWRFTLGRNEQAQVFSEAFAARLNQPSSVEHETITHQPADALQEGELAPLQGNWGLLRLWRFAEPYKGQLFLGFILTLASTAAT
jgi:ATP-binding cassette subfamily B protein